jgi:hypothetical protein
MKDSGNGSGNGKGISVFLHFVYTILLQNPRLTAARYHG